MITLVANSLDRLYREQSFGPRYRNSSLEDWENKGLAERPTSAWHLNKQDDMFKG